MPASAVMSMKFGRRFWFRLLRSLALVYVGVCVVIMLFERSLVFQPLRYPAGNWQPSSIKFEDAEFAAADGTKLHGWFVPHEKPRAVVLFAHGSGGNVTLRADMLRELNRLGAAVLLFDYRGFGKSEGSPSEAGILSDARAARSWLAKRAGVAERDIVLMGESLGTGVVVDLAAVDGARGLILLSAFTSRPDVAAWHRPWLPMQLLMRIRLNSLSKIADYQGPLLSAHGDADKTVPYAQGQQLFEAANEPKRFVTLAGCDHGAPPPAEFYRTVDDFLGSLSR